MSGSTNEASFLLPFEKFRFSLRVTSLMVLPPYKGGIFRGAFGNAFRRVVCVAPREDCATCLLNQKCLYVSIFEPRSPQYFSDANKFNNAPPPYVLNPPLTNRQAFHPHETMEFDLVLIGRAIDALPYFIYTFHELGRMGLGRERGKYEISGVNLVRNDNPTQIYDGRTQTLNSYSPKDETISRVRAEDTDVTSLTLKILTPLRLKVNGELVTQLSFPLFFERLAQRLSLLAVFYDSNSCPNDLTQLISQAQQIETSSADLHWYDWERYSRRQDRAMKLGGLKGNIAFAGELGPFMPCLRLGEQVNVGQGTSFGLGNYSLESTSQ